MRERRKSAGAQEATDPAVLFWSLYWKRSKNQKQAPLYSATIVCAGTWMMPCRLRPNMYIPFS